jgi:hypothetical protein
VYYKKCFPLLITFAFSSKTRLWCWNDSTAGWTLYAPQGQKLIIKPCGVSKAFIEVESAQELTQWFFPFSPSLAVSRLIMRRW